MAPNHEVVDSTGHPSNSPSSESSWNTDDDNNIGVGLSSDSEFNANAEGDVPTGLSAVPDVQNSPMLIDTPVDSGKGSENPDARADVPTGLPSGQDTYRAPKSIADLVDLGNDSDYVNSSEAESESVCSNASVGTPLGMYTYEEWLASPMALDYLRALPEFQEWQRNVAQSPVNDRDIKGQIRHYEREEHMRDIYNAQPENFARELRKLVSTQNTSRQQSLLAPTVPGVPEIKVIRASPTPEYMEYPSNPQFQSTVPSNHGNVQMYNSESDSDDTVVPALPEDPADWPFAPPGVDLFPERNAQNQSQIPEGYQPAVQYNPNVSPNANRNTTNQASNPTISYGNTQNESFAFADLNSDDSGFNRFLNELPPPDCITNPNRAYIATPPVPSCVRLSSPTPPPPPAMPTTGVNSSTIPGVMYRGVWVDDPELLWYINRNVDLMALDPRDFEKVGFNGVAQGLYKFSRELAAADNNSHLLQAQQAPNNNLQNQVMLGSATNEMIAALSRDQAEIEARPAAGQTRQQPVNTPQQAGERSGQNGNRGMFIPASPMNPTGDINGAFYPAMPAWPAAQAGYSPMMTSPTVNDPDSPAPKPDSTDKEFAGPTDFYLKHPERFNWTLTDIVVFLPLSVRNYFIAWRLYSNSLSSAMHLEIENYFKEPPKTKNPQNPIAGRYRKAIRQGPVEGQDNPNWKADHNIARRKPTNWDSNNINMAGYKSARETHPSRVKALPKFTSIPLLELATTLQRWPEGADVGDLGRAVWFAVREKESNGAIWMFPDDLEVIQDMIGPVIVTAEHSDEACIRRHKQRWALEHPKVKAPRMPKTPQTAQTPEVQAPAQNQPFPRTMQVLHAAPSREELAPKRAKHRHQ